VKLKYETVHFKKIKKRNIHDQYNVFENTFNIQIGLIIWSDYSKKYGYLSVMNNWHCNELPEITEFLKQLNNENTNTG
jgi:hypothetical protein